MTGPLALEEADPRRPEIEAALRALPEAELRALHATTRAAAAAARRAADLPDLIRLVRGSKTLQRIAAERGLVLRARPVRGDRGVGATG